MGLRRVGVEETMSVIQIRSCEFVLPRGANGAGKVTSNGTVVIMAIFKMIEKGSVCVRAWVGGERERTSAGKRFWPRSSVCSLKQPAIIASLRSQFQNRLLFGGYTHKVTHPFSGHEHRASPSRYRLRFTVEAFATYAARKFHRCIARVNNWEGC